MYPLLTRISQSLIHSCRKSASHCLVYNNNMGRHRTITRSLCETNIPEETNNTDVRDIKLVSNRNLKRKLLAQRQIRNTDERVIQRGDRKVFLEKSNSMREQSLEKMLEDAKPKDIIVETDDPSSEFPSDQQKYLNWKRQQKRHSFRPKVNPEDTSIVLFPGQGSQFIGMGRHLLEYPNVAEMYELASDLLQFDLLSLCLNGPQEDLNRTMHCQLAVFVTSLAAVERLRAQNPQAIDNCVGVAGFSVGEYAALVFAGALSFEDALMVLKTRADAMQYASEAVPSGMMTVFCGPQSKLRFGMLAAKEYCRQKLGIEDPVCSVANFLCPEVKVIAGHAEALNFLTDNAGEFKLKRLKMLPVSGAFHTSLMKSAVKPVAQVLKNIDIQKPLIPVHCNVSGLAYRNSNMISKLLVEQIHSPVKWEQIMHILFSRNKGHAFPKTYEAGPGKQLGILLKQVNALAYEQYRYVEV